MPAKVKEDKPQTQTEAAAKPVATVKKEIDGNTAKVVAVFSNIDFKAETGGPGYKKGFVIADDKKQATLVGETTLRGRYPNVELSQDAAEFDGGEDYAKLAALCKKYELLGRSRLLEMGKAANRRL